MSKIRVVMCPARRAPYITEMDGSLESMQEAVGGYIECVTQPDGSVIICNEEGRILAMSDNKSLPGLVGDCFICGSAGEELVGLSENEAASWLHICKKHYMHGGVRYVRKAWCGA